MKWAFYLCAHSGIVTGWMIILSFVDALFGFNNNKWITLSFIVA